MVCRIAFRSRVELTSRLIACSSLRKRTCRSISLNIRPWAMAMPTCSARAMDEAISSGVKVRPAERVSRRMMPISSFWKRIGRVSTPLTPSRPAASRRVAQATSSTWPLYTGCPDCTMAMVSSVSITSLDRYSSDTPWAAPSTKEWVDASSRRMVQASIPSSSGRARTMVSITSW